MSILKPIWTSKPIENIIINLYFKTHFISRNNSKVRYDLKKKKKQI